MLKHQALTDRTLYTISIASAPSSGEFVSASTLPALELKFPRTKRGKLDIEVLSPEAYIAWYANRLMTRLGESKIEELIQLFIADRVLVQGKEKFRVPSCEEVCQLWAMQRLPQLSGGAPLIGLSVLAEPSTSGTSHALTLWSVNERKKGWSFAYCGIGRPGVCSKCDKSGAKPVREMRLHGFEFFNPEGLCVCPSCAMGANYLIAVSGDSDSDIPVL